MDLQGNVVTRGWSKIWAGAASGAPSTISVQLKLDRLYRIYAKIWDHSIITEIYVHQWGANCTRTIYQPSASNWEYGLMYTVNNGNVQAIAVRKDNNTGSQFEYNWNTGTNAGASTVFRIDEYNE